MRAKLPKGKGAFPAFWTLGNAYKWPSNGELDVLEMIGSPTEQRAAELIIYKDIMAFYF